MIDAKTEYTENECACSVKAIGTFVFRGKPRRAVYGEELVEHEGPEPRPPEPQLPDAYELPRPPEIMDKAKHKKNKKKQKQKGKLDAAATSVAKEVPSDAVLRVTEDMVKRHIIAVRVAKHRMTTNDTAKMANDIADLDQAYIEISSDLPTHLLHYEDELNDGFMTIMALQQMLADIGVLA